MNLYTDMIMEQLGVPADVALEIQARLEKSLIDLSECTKEEFRNSVSTACNELISEKVNEMFKPKVDRYIGLLEKEYKFFIDECISFFKDRPDIKSEFGDTEITAEGVERYLRDIDFSGDVQHTIRESGYIKGLRDAIEILSK